MKTKRSKAAHYHLSTSWRQGRLRGVWIYSQSLIGRTIRKIFVAIAPNASSRTFQLQSRQFYDAMSRHDVRYLVIGGAAVQFYAPNRRTFDLDILVDRSLENVRAVLLALRDCGLAAARLSSEEEIKANDVTIFSEKIRIDVSCESEGIQFERAWTRRIVIDESGLSISVSSPQDLIGHKRVYMRDVDIADIALLHSFLETTRTRRDVTLPHARSGGYRQPANR